MRQDIVFYLNGIKKTVHGENAFISLSSYLRNESHLTGTKVVCAEGDCGACTVMVARWSPNRGFKYQSLNSCIVMMFAMDGANIVTVEGLGQRGKDSKAYSPDVCSEVQCSMMRNFGAQCGFCTPGFVMSITSMLEDKSENESSRNSVQDSTSTMSEQTVKNYLTGNLCRCTGYTPIIKAALDVDQKKHIYIKNQYPPIDLSFQMQEEVKILTKECEYFAPIAIKEACAYLFNNPSAVIYSGGTDLGVQINKNLFQPQKILSLHLIKELYDLRIVDSHIVVGARISIDELQKYIKDKISSMDNFLNVFASPQIKNVATLVGNIANASPIADMIPVLMALNAEVIIEGSNGQKKIELQNFYLGYKKINLQKGEIITHIKFDIPNKNNIIQNYKVSQRRDLDISTVNASFNFELSGSIIQSARIVYGGLGPQCIRIFELEKQIVNKEISDQMVADMVSYFKTLIGTSIRPISDLRGSAEYRSLVAINLFKKFMLHLRESLGEDLIQAESQS